MTSGAMVTNSMLLSRRIISGAAKHYHQPRRDVSAIAISSGLPSSHAGRRLDGRSHDTQQPSPFPASSRRNRSSFEVEYDKLLTQRNKSIIMHPEGHGQHILPGNFVVKKNERTGAEKKVILEHALGYFWAFKVRIHVHLLMKLHVASPSTERCSYYYYWIRS